MTCSGDYTMLCITAHDLFFVIERRVCTQEN